MELDKNVFELKYNVIIERIDHFSGEVLDHEEIHNTIVNDGKQRVAELIGGVSANVFVGIQRPTASGITCSGIVSQ